MPNLTPDEALTIYQYSMAPEKLIIYYNGKHVRRGREIGLCGKYIISVEEEEGEIFLGEIEHAINNNDTLLAYDKLYRYYGEVKLFRNASEMEILMYEALYRARC